MKQLYYNTRYPFLPFIQFILGISVIISFFASLFLVSFDLLLISVFLLWLNNLTYSIKKIHERFIYFILHITIFTFILSRPMIDLCQANDWVANTYRYHSLALPEKTIFLLFISLLGIYIGGVLASNLKVKKKIRERISVPQKDMLQFITLIAFWVSFSFGLLRGYEKLSFRSTHSYTEYYQLFTSHLPYVVYVISSFNKYCVCFFLATKPEKRSATLILVLYVLLAVPDFIVGSRGEFIIRLLFSLFYYVYRDYCVSPYQWVGKIERLLLIICTPLGIIFLGLFNYIREGISFNGIHVSTSIIDFFYKQGVTFSWISCGLGVINQLPAHVCYTFGTIVDYILYGSLGQIIFGTEGIPSNNTAIHGTRGNSLSHHLSYIVLGNKYLEGHGTGSSYLLESYIDFGYIGVFIISLFIGILSIALMRAAKKYFSIAIITFLTFTGIIYMPRNEFGQIIGFLTYIQFWFITICCILAALLLKRRYRRKLNE